jgi:aldose 1-epimerase
MTTIVLESSALRVALLPALGAGVADLSLRRDDAWWPLLRRAQPEPDHFNQLACYLLAPWSNRIEAGAFTFAGRNVRISPNWSDGSAIHGEVCALPWQVEQRGPSSAAMRVRPDPGPGRWPWAYECRVRYEVHAARFTSRLDVTNLDTTPMPAGLGFHPFFAKAVFSTGDRACIRLPSGGRFPAARMLPTDPARQDVHSRALGAGVPADDLDLDDVFLGSPESAEVRWPASGVLLRFGSCEGAGFSVVYAPQAAAGPPPYFCLEPVTMLNNGFNLMARGWTQTGVKVLAPGESMSLAWTFGVEQAGAGR